MDKIGENKKMGQISLDLLDDDRMSTAVNHKAMTSMQNQFSNQCPAIKMSYNYKVSKF